MHQPFQIQLPRGDLDKKSLAHVVAIQGREVGLEPNKSAYKEKLASLGGPESRHVSWVRRLFGEKPKAPKSGAPPKSELRPCTGKECKPVPVPPKPCVGSKCPKPQPPPKAVAPTVGGVCTSGYMGSNGGCQPWGYFRDCTYYGSAHPFYCRIQWASVNPSYCLQILRELDRQQMQLQQARFAQASTCSTAPQSPDCVRLTQRLNEIMGQIQQLQQQYRMCTAAAGLYVPPPTGSRFPNSWPPHIWP